MSSSVFDVVPASALTRRSDAPSAYDIGPDGSPSEESIAAFERDGVVCLRGVLGEEEVVSLQDAVDRSAQQPGPLGYKVGTPGEPGFFYYDFEMHQRLDAFRWLVFDSRVPDIGAALMRSVGVTLYYSNLFIKDAYCDASTPWHEDAAYQRMNGMSVINFWLALDEVPEETALLFKRGSHLRDSQVYEAYHFDGGKPYDHPIITRDRVEMPAFADLDRAFPTIWWTVRPGDALVFTQRTLHAAPGNPRDKPRRAANLMLLGDAATYNASPGESDPPFKDETLADGVHPAGDQFIRLR